MRFTFAGKPIGGADSGQRIKLWDYLLVVATCLAPMTGLRIGKIGPAEVVFLIWCVKQLIHFRFAVSDTLKFFLFFYMSLIAGSLAGSIIASNELRMNGLYTWTYLAIIAICLYQGLYSNSAAYNEKLLFIIATASLLWQIFLYYYSINVNRRLFGAPLWYSLSRYSGGGTNPHQVALMFCGMLFVFVREIMSRRHVAISVVLAAYSYFLMDKTASSTGNAAIVLGALILIYFAIGNFGGKNKIALYFLVTILILMVAAIVSNKIVQFVSDWISADKNGDGRLRIFSSLGYAFRKSPIFGLGPGVHGQNGRIEFHNTYLEVIAATGIVGSIVFIIYTVRIVKSVVAADWRLLPVIIAIYAYGLGGFALRRLIYWAICMFVLALADSIIRESRMQSLNSMQALDRYNY